MAQEIAKEHEKPTHGTAHDMLSKYGSDNPDKINAKRERFLALLKSQYGYTNDKAVDELERLLKQFYRSNKSLNIHLGRASIMSSTRTPRKGKGNKLAGKGLV